MKTSSTTWLMGLLLSICVVLTQDVSSSVVVGATPFQASDERTISRYLLLLEKRPVAGTAFDRVFNFYDQDGRLDLLVGKLKQPGKSEQATAARNLLLGMLHVRNQDPEAAIQQLQRAKQGRPSDPTVDDQMAEAWMLQSQLAKAADSWQSALGKTTNRTSALAIVQRLTAVYGRQRESEKSLGVLLKFEEQFPGTPEIQDLLTTALIDAGRTSEAVKRLNERLSESKSPDDRLKLETSLANLMFKTGRTDEAIEAYKAILTKLNRDSWQAEEVDQKLQQLLAKQPGQRALEEFLTERVKAHPSSLKKRLDLMKFFSDKGKHEDSLLIASNASDSQQKSADLIRGRILSHLALQEYDKVEAEFRQLETTKQLSTDDVIRWGQIAFAQPDLSVSERESKAVQTWDKLLTLTDAEVPDWQRAALLAKQLALAGMPEAAMVRYSQAIQSNQASSDIFVGYARVLVQQADTPKAVAVLQQLVSRSSKSPANVYVAIDALKIFGQIEAAITFARQLVEQDSTIDHRMLLAELLLLNSDFSSADEQLELVLESSSADQNHAARQQIVDLLLKTGFVTTKLQQLKSANGQTERTLLLLAKLAEVQGELTLALQTLQKIPQGSELQISSMEMQAGLQQKAGQLKNAEATLIKLLALMPKRAVEYQESIQNLQLQMGRDEDAYQTARALFQRSPESASSVGRYVAFLKNSDRQQQAISVLTTFLSEHDSSASMMVQLGDLLAEQFRSDEAMAWFWRAMDRSTSEMLQRDIANRLVVLALRTNQTQTVLERLKSTGNQNSSATASQRTLLMVDAYRQAHQLTDAVRELKNLLNTEGGSISALTELVDLLSKLDRSDEAIQYQFQLAQRNPTVEVFRLLAELLSLQPDITLFQSELLQLSRSNGWPKVALDLADSLFTTERIEDALVVIQSLKQSNLPAWKLESGNNYAVLVLQGPQAAAVQALKMVDQTTSASELLQMSMLGRPANLFRASTFSEALVIAGEIAVLGYSAQPASSRHLLELWQTKKRQLGSGGSNPIAFAKYSLVLHRAAGLDSGELSNVATLLASLKTPDGDAAALSALLGMSYRVEAAVERSGTKEAALKEATLKEATGWDSGSGGLALQLLGRLRKTKPELVSSDIMQWVHRFFLESGLPAEAQMIRRSIITESLTNDLQQLATYWSMAESSGDLVLADQVLERWIGVCEEGLVGSPQFGGQVSLILPENFGRSLALFCSLATVQQRGALLQKFLLLKSLAADTSGSSTSSGSERSFEIHWIKKTSHRVFEGGRHVGSRNVVTLPETFPVKMTDITFFVNLLHGLSAEEQNQLVDFALRLLDRQDQVASNVIYRLASSYLLCLHSGFDDAILQLIAAAKEHPEMGSLRVLIAAYHAENGHSVSALNLLETISSSDIVAFRQALWLKFRIGSSSGQLAVTDQAIRLLLGTRLTLDERRHLALVTKNRQLPVEVSESPSSSTRNARPMETLINQMLENQKAGEVDKAIEIANTVLLTGDATEHSTSMANAARRSAVELLAKHNQLQTAFVDIERRLDQDSNSADLLRLKLQVLNGMNRTVDAQKVQLQLESLVPESAEEWIQKARALEQDRRFIEAVDAYLKAFQADPSLLLADYYRYFKTFRRVDRLPDIADLLMESDLRQLRDNYFVVSELIDILLSQSDATELGRRSIDSGFQLLSAAWKAYPSDRDYLLNNIQAKRLWESKLVVEFICDRMIPDSTQQAFARPWLGLDSKPVAVQGEGRLFALQRVLRYLKNQEARSSFLRQVIAGQKQYPEWLAGPYIEVALTVRSADFESVRRRLFRLIDAAVDESTESELLPIQMAALNAAAILRGVDPAIDGRLAVLVGVVMSENSSSSMTGSFPRNRDLFSDSTDRLLAELQFSAGDIAAGRRTVLQAIRMLPLATGQTLDAEAAWNRIQSVLSAVELLRSANLVLDAVNVSKAVHPGLLSASRGFQSNDSLDRSCQRMWQQADRSVQSASVRDVLTYLKFQNPSLQDGQVAQWDLQLNTPLLSDRISWRNSDLISIMRRIAKTNPDGAKAIADKLHSGDGDQLSASLCLLALESPTENSVEYVAAVQRFIDRFVDAVATGQQIPNNGVLAWCLINPLRKQLASGVKDGVPSEKLIQQVLEFALAAGAGQPEMKVWKHCILNEAAQMLRSSGNAGKAADAWSEALNSVVPSLAKQPSTDRSPLKETRRLLLGP